MRLCCSPALFILPLNLGWTWELIGPIELDGNDVRFPSLAYKRPHSFHFCTSGKFPLGSQASCHKEAQPGLQIKGKQQRDPQENGRCVACSESDWAPAECSCMMSSASPHGAEQPAEHSQPSESWEIIKHCCFNPLNSGWFITQNL